MSTTTERGLWRGVLLALPLAALGWLAVTASIALLTDAAPGGRRPLSVRWPRDAPAGGRRARLGHALVRLGRLRGAGPSRAASTAPARSSCCPRDCRAACPSACQAGEAPPSSEPTRRTQMLFGQQPQEGATAGAADLIKDGTEASFMADVIEGSRETPVIVDFWAEWCGPCKTLGPMLEAAVTKAKGRVRMVKIDGRRQPAPRPDARPAGPAAPVDPHRRRLRRRPARRHVPGRPCPSRRSTPSSSARRRSPATAASARPSRRPKAMLAEGAAVDAAQTFAAILGEEPGSAPAYGGLIRAHLAMGEADRAKQLLEAVPEAIANAPEIEAARAQLVLAEQAASAGPVADLTAQVEASPDDHQARYDLATALQASGDTEGAVDQLLELFRRDREWEDGKAKDQLPDHLRGGGGQGPGGAQGTAAPGVDDPDVGTPPPAPSTRARGARPPPGRMARVGAAARPGEGQSRDGGPPAGRGASRIREALRARGARGDAFAARRRGSVSAGRSRTSPHPSTIARARAVAASPRSRPRSSPPDRGTDAAAADGPRVRI